MGMGKPKQSSKGFSTAKPAQATKQQLKKYSVDQTAKEQQAEALINQGKLQEAEVIYRELIAEGTNNYIVYGNLAIICGIQSRHDELITLLKRTIELNPNHPEAHYNLGIGLKRQGNFTAAINSYNTALKLNPNHPEAHNNLGNALTEQGDLEAAIAACNKAIELKPNYPEAHNNLGNALTEQGDLEAAIAACNKAIELKPNYPEAHNNLGNALQGQGNLEAAIASFNTALQLNPNYPQAHYNLGNALTEQGDLEAAIVSFNTALQLNPNYPQALNNLGNTLTKQGDLEAAIASFNTALQLNPSYPEAFNNLGNTLTEQGDLEAAIASCNKAIELKPSYPEAHYNLGNALHGQGHLESAIASFNTALQLKPNYPEAHWNSSLTILLGGDYSNGWKEYEWRFKSEREISRPHALPKCSKWDGRSAKQNHKLLLVSEQGLGDTLQFMRYVIALRNEGILVSLCAQRKLHTLIQSSGIDPSPLTPEQANQVKDGHWIPLLSVPRHLEVSPSNPLITEPYIKTNNELSTKWNSILSVEKNPIVGLNWQGNPKAEKTVLRGRSLRLETFAPIANQTNASLLSLQKGFGSEQLETCSFKHRFVSCQDQINDTWDFLDTAAIIANCDLVITSDTSVAHLAGGMGKTTWLLLKKVPEWRWGLEGDTTFWYPSMRLFRQRERGNWDEVMERVAEELQKQFASNPQATQAAPAATPPSKPETIQDIQAPISLGELIDKITILQIKTQHLQYTALENVKKELEALETTLKNLQLNIDTTLIQRLKEVNQDLWQTEDAIRDEERQESFGETFIHLARSVYRQNDRRAAIKKEINTTYRSPFVEEKSYQAY
jgi:tetratricopeptide (TPR) repeat protein